MMIVEIAIKLPTGDTALSMEQRFDDAMARAVFDDLSAVLVKLALAPPRLPQRS